MACHPWHLGRRRLWTAPHVLALARMRACPGDFASRGPGNQLICAPLHCCSASDDLQGASAQGTQQEQQQSSSQTVEGQSRPLSPFPGIKGEGQSGKQQRRRLGSCQPQCSLESQCGRCLRTLLTHAASLACRVMHVPPAASYLVCRTSGAVIWQSTPGVASRLHGACTTREWCLHAGPGGTGA